MKFEPPRMIHLDVQFIRSQMIEVRKNQKIDNKRRLSKRFFKLY